MADYGTPIGVDELLRLGGIAHSYTNERIGRANALRGLLKLGPISAPQTGIDAGLRSVSTARDDEITNAIFADIVAEKTPSVIEGGSALPVISQEQVERVFRKKYPQYVDRYLSPTLKLWSSYSGQKQKEMERLEDINKSSGERAAARDFDEFQKEWNASDQTNATFNKLVTKYISKTSKPGRDPAAVAYLKGLITASYGTRGERASAVTRKDKLALDDATQYVIDTTISGVEGGMSASGAYSNAVSSVRSGVVSGKYDDQEAVRRLKALGYNVVPLTKKEQVALDKAQLELSGKREKLAEEKATQYVVDATIRGVKSGMSVEAAYNNAVQASRSGAVAGKFNDVDAVRKLKALGHDVVPPTTSWVFDLDKQEAVRVSERTLRQNPTKYGPPLSSVNGKLTENYFNAGMAMLVADQAAIAKGDTVKNPMTLDLLVFYNTNGLVKLRKEDVGVMGRWSAAAQALKSAAKPASVSDLDKWRQMYKPDKDDNDPDVKKSNK